METIKVCSKCKKSKTLDHYRPERQLCNQCVEEKALYREKHREQLQEKAKEYYKNNKDVVLEKRKEYIEQNRDKVLEQKKDYRERNKDKIQEANKGYYAKNREEILIKKKEYQKRTVECPICKCMVGKYQYSRHEETNKHKNNMMIQS